MQPMLERALAMAMSDPETVSITRPVGRRGL
jgi:hypothetical protein